MKKATLRMFSKSAENRAASSLWVGRYRYVGILGASKVLRGQSDLRLKNIDFELVPNQLKIGQRVASG